MVVTDHFNGVEAFQCEECGRHYTEQDQAEVCEDVGETYGECDPDIGANALEEQGDTAITF